MVQTEQADCQQVAETDIADFYRVVEGGGWTQISGSGNNNITADRERERDIKHKITYN